MAWFRRKRKQPASIPSPRGETAVDPDSGQLYELALVPAGNEPGKQDPQSRDLAGKVWGRLKPAWADQTSLAADHKTTDAATMAAFIGSEQYAQAYYERTKLEQSRRAKYDDVVRMYRESPLARRALKVVCDSAYSGESGDQHGHEVETDDERVKGVLDDLDERVGMREYSPKKCKSTLKWGDGFTEPVVDAAGSVVRLKWLSPKQVYRNEDEYGRPLEDRAFTQSTEDGTKEVASFYWWQMVHLRYDHELESRYGTSFFDPARVRWRQHGMQIDGVVIRRLVRSGKRYAYVVPLPKTQSRVEQDRMMRDIEHRVRRTTMVDSSGNRDTRHRPAIEEKDIFLPWTDEKMPPKVDMLDPGGLNDNLEDVKFLRDEMIVGLGVPPTYLGLDKEVRGRAHLGWVDIQFARTLRDVQMLMARGFHRRIYDLQLILAGMMNARDQYKVVFPKVSFVDEKLKMEVQMLRWNIVSQARLELGVPLEWLLSNVLLLDDEKVQEILPNLQPVQQMPVPGREPTGREYNDIAASLNRNRRLVNELHDLRDRIVGVIDAGLHKQVTA